MEQEYQPFIPVQKFGIKDALVLSLIIITFFLAGQVIQSEKTQYVVIVINEKVEDEVLYYQTQTKEKVEELITEKLKIYNFS